ncbi:MAG: S-layer homology domain-containing protein [Andreesenia angusta]|nr:S-layer homology domain-containing protein [Andreesenia angusta]
MNLKKVLSLALASTLLCGSMGLASGLNDGNFYRAYMGGYPDGTIKPDGQISRAEALAVYSRLKEQSQNVEATKSSEYPDAQEGWFKQYIDYAAENEIVKGYPDGNFRPENKITRAEFSNILAKMVEDTDKSTDFPDIQNHWGKASIEKLAAAGIINGYPDGSFRPDDEIKRAEAAKMLNILYNRVTDDNSLKGIDESSLKEFSDLNNTHWGYYNLVEASNDHIADLKDGKEAWRELVSKDEIKKAEEKLIKKSEAIKNLGLEKQPNSVATDSWPATYNLVTAGVNIVGGPEDHHLDEWIENTYTKIVQDKKLDLDKVKELKPETVIMKDKDDINAVINEIGAKRLDYDFESLDEMYSKVGELASAFGTRDAFVNNMIKINRRLEVVKEKSDKNNNPAVALIIVGREEDNDGKETGNLFYALPKTESFADDMIKSGNMKNIGDSIDQTEDYKYGFFRTNLDDIMKKDPDAVVLLMRGDKKLRNKGEKDVRDLLAKKYSESKAVKSGRIGRIDHHTILPKSSLEIAGVEAISAVANKEANEIPSELKDGVYYGTGTGYAGGLTTKVTVKDGKISDVEVVSNNDTDFKIGKVVEYVPKSIVEKQSLKEEDLLKDSNGEILDAVSKSTTSSRGIIESVSNALSKAK